MLRPPIAAPSRAPSDAAPTAEVAASGARSPPGRRGYPADRGVGGRRDQLRDRRLGAGRSPGRPGAPAAAAYAGLICGSTPDAGGRHRVGGHLGRGHPFAGGDQRPSLLDLVEQLLGEPALVASRRRSTGRRGPSTSSADAEGRVWNHGSAAGSAGTGSIPISDEPAGLPSERGEHRALGARRRARASGPPPTPPAGRPARAATVATSSMRSAAPVCRQQHGDHSQIPGMSRTSRSIRKIPTNGVSTPPSP